MSGDAFNMLLILQHKQLRHVGNSEHPQPSPPITPFISPTLQWIPRENFTVSLNISQLPMFHEDIYTLCFTFHLFAALPNTSFLILATLVRRHKSLFYGCCTIFLLTAVILHYATLYMMKNEGEVEHDMHSRTNLLRYSVDRPIHLSTLRVQ